MNLWKLTYNDFIPKQEPLRETLTTLGNGYIGTRGATCETGSSDIHYPGTYIAGLYNNLPTEIAGKTIYNEDLVNCPNWLVFRYKINDGPWFHFFNVELLDYKVELDMHNGILIKHFRFKDRKGRITSINHQRIVSMADPHLLAFRYTFRPENYSGKITIFTGLDGQVVNNGVDRYRQLNNKHLVPVDVGKFGEDSIYLRSKANHSKIKISEAMRTFAYEDDKRFSPELSVIEYGRHSCMHELILDVHKNHRYSVEKVVSVYTSKDQGITDDLREAIKKAGQAYSFSQLYDNHKQKWKELWSLFDIELDGDDFFQKVLRLHTFHLLQTASFHNKSIDAGMPARGLHGEAYRGHIFWDELFVLPFYNLRAPEISRALLMYRYRRLGAAKKYAAKHGYKGAMYPWQSASTGDETTQIIHLNPLSGNWGPDYSSNQRHVSAAVAYNVWKYYYSSGDKQFLQDYGAEIIVEIAHFWSSISEYNKITGRYDISGVMGPDEFHEKYPDSEEGGLKNNAYTNVMAVWVIEKALFILDDLLSPQKRKVLLEKAGINKQELERWHDITEKMTIPIDENGIISQFEGYMDLEELDWDYYREKYKNIHRIDRILKAEKKSPDCYKVSKQADVLMLFYVLREETLEHIFEKLGYKFDPSIFEKNFDYYYPRTSHGSTLSLVVYSYVCSIFKHKSKTLKLFQEAMESDIYDKQGGTTCEGIHTGIMAGTIDVFLRVFAGLEILNDKICL
ncbi:MAG: glycoside hydrolase family 65 protein, partial [Actinomycetota bacterium]